MKKNIFFRNLVRSKTILWGINLYPETMGDKFIEFDSMIILGRLNNFSRSVENIGDQTKLLYS